MAIVAAPTSVTAFIGATESGPTDGPTLVHTVAQFTGIYGGLSTPLSHTVSHYFVNGGRDALISRADDPVQGLAPLDLAEDVNLICIPPPTLDTDIDRPTWDAAVAYAERRGAMVIVDPPRDWSSADAAVAGVAAVVDPSGNATMYFPRVTVQDPPQGSNIDNFPACGAIAGVIARTDATRGVWAAPAGGNAMLVGVDGLATAVTDRDTDDLKPVGINTLRMFPGSSPVVWGGRTLAGPKDRDWTYVPVRRTAMHIEQSVLRSTQWTVFEPNDEPLWSRLRQDIDEFLLAMFRADAFSGSTPSAAFFVKCDNTTTTADDIAAGVVNVVIGFAPSKPAEFVLITLALRAQAP